mmetsp:Transcript_14663/g.27480  ORF Transcript_14663/g.27480 Transcript_14663/m.27480 type:complete len:216 (-) Transcript_14663:255-902(-)
MISWFDACHSWSNRFHNAPSFMTKNTRKETLWVLPIKSIYVSVAQCIGNHFDANFPSFWGVNCNCFLNKRFTRLSCNHGFACYRLALRRREIISRVCSSHLSKFCSKSTAVIFHMTFDKGGNEMIRMIKALSHMNGHFLPDLLGRIIEHWRVQLLNQKFIICSLINQNIIKLGTFRQQARCIVNCSCFNTTKVRFEGLFAPGYLCRVTDRSKGRH